MRKYYISILIVLSVFLVSCGGGGGGSSSGKASVNLKLNFEASKSISGIFGKSGGLTIGNTTVTSVLLQYGKHGGSMTSLDVSNAVFNHTDVVLSEIEIGGQYDFYLAAYADGEVSGNTLACQAASTSQTIADGVNIALNCTISNAKDIDMLSESVFSVIQDAARMMLSSADPTDLLATIDGYVSKDISEGGSFPETGHDGNPREYFTMMMTYWMVYQFYYEGAGRVDLMSVDVVEPLDRSSVESKVTGTEGGTYSADLLMTFSNNAKLRLPVNFVYENGKWKLNGNGRKFSAALLAEHILFPDGFGNAELYSGYSMNMYGDYLYYLDDPNNDVEGVVYRADSSGDPTIGIGEQPVAFNMDVSSVIKKDPMTATGHGKLDRSFFPSLPLMENSISSIPAGSVIKAELERVDEMDNATPIDTTTFRTSAEMVSASSVRNTDFPHIYLESGSNPTTSDEIVLKIVKPSTGSEIAYYMVDLGTDNFGNISGHNFLIGPDETELRFTIGDQISGGEGQNGYLAFSAVDIYERFFTVVFRIDDGRLIMNSVQTRPTIKTFNENEINGMKGFYHYIDGIGDYNFSGLVDGNIVTSSTSNGLVDVFPYFAEYNMSNLNSEKPYKQLVGGSGSSYNYSVYKFFEIGSSAYTVSMNYEAPNYYLSVGRLYGATKRYATTHYNAGQSDYMPFSDPVFVDAAVNNSGNTIIAVVKGQKDALSSGEFATAVYLINISDLSLQAVYGLENFHPTAVAAEYGSTDFILGGTYEQGGFKRAAVLLMSSGGVVKSTVLVGAASVYEHDLTLNHLTAVNGSLFASGNLYDTNVNPGFGRVALIKFRIGQNSLSYSSSLVYSNAYYIDASTYGKENLTAARNTGTVTLAFHSGNSELTINTVTSNMVHRWAYKASFIEENDRLNVIEAPYSSGIVTGAKCFYAQSGSAVFVNLSHFDGDEVSENGLIHKYTTTLPSSNVYIMSEESTVPTITPVNLLNNAGNWQTTTQSLNNSYLQDAMSGSFWDIVVGQYMP